MSLRSRPLLPLATLALGAVVLALGAPFVAGAAVLNPTAKSVLAATQKAMVKESGVHVKVTSTNGTTISKVVVDIGASYGAETIQNGTKKVSIIVTPTAAYLSGTQSGLTQIMGLTAAEQKKVGARSIMMKAGTSPYMSFAANLTTVVFPSILPKLKGTKLSIGAGSKNYLLTWTTSATSSGGASKNVFTISSGKKSLPVKEVVSTKAGGGTTTFTKWGEHVVETAPASSSTIPYASVVHK